jgi:hypothetical protein
MDYFNEYDRAPGRDIETLFFRKAKDLPKEDAEDIEDILEGLSDEFEREKKFNVDYLLDQTHTYLDERNLQEFAEDIQNEVDKGNLTEAKKLAGEYRPVAVNTGSSIDLSDPESLDRLKKAFRQVFQPVIKYPRQLGQFWNRELVRDAFVSLWGPEKRGKTWWLLEFAMRAARQKSNVAFFQAGDMSEMQQMVRIAVYQTKKSNLEEYSGKMFQPVRDCIHNQMDTCDRDERECDHGIFDNDEAAEYVRNEVTYDELVKKYKENPDYIPCHNCPLYWDRKRKYGVPWMQEVDSRDPLTEEEAVEAHEEFFIKRNRRFKLASYPTDTLTVSEIRSQLELWERQDQFIPDVIIIDYADILAPEARGDKRDQIDQIWKRLRGLSLEKHCLVITASQTDTDSYKRDRIGRSNFSDNKSKSAHVTATFGLNQDKDWREKEIGIMRLNKVVLREGAYTEKDEVYVLQNLSRGQPCLGSFW